MALSASDQRFAAAVEAIYEAAPAPSRWPDALQEIADVFDDVGANLIWRRDDGQFGVIVSPRLQAAAHEYEAKWARQDIRAARGAEQTFWVRTDAVTDRHLVTNEELQSHPFYTQFLAGHGLRWLAATGASPDPHVMVGISVQRAASKPAYSDEELKTLARLGRHAEKSLRLSIKLLDTQLTNTGLGEALTRIGIGVFALDSLGRVVFANPAAERLCGGSIDIVQTRLRIGSGAERVAIDDAIMHTLRAEATDLLADPKPILVPRAASERPLIVYLLPIGASAAATEQFLTHTRAIVLVIDSQSDQPADPAVVRDVLGLTLGEARVAALIGFGLSPRDAGERLGISEETARTTLKRVFSKVGVSRQSALAALLSKLVLR